MLHHVRTGQGPPLLLVHGIAMSHHAFHGTAEALAGDFTVYAVDLPGFGESDLLPGPPTMRALADACAELVDEPFAVAGNSLGGGVALHLALDGRAGAACALSPVGFVEGWEKLWLHAITRSAGVLFPPLAPLGDFAPVRKYGVAVIAEHGDRVSPERFRAALADAQRPGLQPAASHALNWRAPSVASLPCPVTIAWSEKDRLLLYGPQSARARERMPSARHVTLDGLGHVPMWDDPDATARVIREAVTAP